MNIFCTFMRYHIIIKIRNRNRFRDATKGDGMICHDSNARTAISDERWPLREKEWDEILSVLDYAFQPIVNIHTGVCYGFEALLRNHEQAGFQNIHDVFDRAFREEMLFTLDLRLREKVLEKFTRLEFHEKTRLFYNIDNRVLVTPDYSSAKALFTMEKFRMIPGAFCFEISERHDFETFILNDFRNLAEIKNTLNFYRQDFYKIAIDDFGSGLSGLQFLYHSEPDYIKIDRFFINGIERDARKRLFVSSTLNMAHVLGIIVIAEGVETEEEFYACKEIGCDFIQGYLVQRPTMNLPELREQYESIAHLNEKNRRDRGSDRDLIRAHMQYIDPVPLYTERRTFTDMGTIFETFRKHKVDTFFPITNGNGEAIGIIRERDLKEYVYSPYGRDILMNKSCGNILNFITRLPISEINTHVEKILELFAMDEKSEGILLAEDGSYVGFLGASDLIMLMNEKNIAEARDQNPLTRLPGNTLINQYISEALADTREAYTFAYFDFDNFKPFNDRFGFRQGDRAILMFADIVKEVANAEKVFIGHIGGDDFFTGFRLSEISAARVSTVISDIVNRFSGDVLSLYSSEDRERGCYPATDREGNERQYPLIGVSVGVLSISAGTREYSMENLFAQLAELKKRAKQSPGKRIVCAQEADETGE